MGYQILPLLPVERFVRGRRRVLIDIVKSSGLVVFIGDWIGGVNFGPLKLFTHDLKPFGLSRDTLVRIYDAIFKATVIVAAVSTSVRGLEEGRA